MKLPLWRRRRREEELEEEIQNHLRMAIRDRMERGESAEEAELALAALNAGVDVLLDVANPVAVVDGLERFVNAGRLPTSRVDDALARVNRLKGAAFGSDKAPERNAELNLRDLTAQRALEVARRATVVFRNEGRVLPFRGDAPTCVVFINPFPLPTGAAPPGSCFSTPPRPFPPSRSRGRSCARGSPTKFAGAGCRSMPSRSRRWSSASARTCGG